MENSSKATMDPQSHFSAGNIRDNRISDSNVRAPGGESL